MAYLGDYNASANIYGKFTTVRPSTGAPFTLAGTPALSVYKDASTTQSTSGVTLTVDFDSVTGLNHFTIDTSTDATFYSNGSNFDVVVTTGTVDSVSAVGFIAGSFSIRKDSALKPVVSGRTISVDSGGTAQANVAYVQSNAIDPYAFHIDTGFQPLTSGSLTGLSNTSATLAGGASSSNDYYTGCTLYLPFPTPGPQSRRIVAYNGSTKVATLDSAFVGANTTEYHLIYTSSHGLPMIPSQVNAEVLDVLSVDTYAEPGKETPLATTSLAEKINFIYKALRNKVTQTSTVFSLWNDGEDVVDQTAQVSDDGTTFTRAELDIGPNVVQMNPYSNIDEPSPVWGSEAVTLTSGQPGPDGANNAVKALTTTTNSGHNHAILDSGSTTYNLLNGETYIMETVIKSVGGYMAGHQAWTSSYSARVERAFDLTNGTIGSVENYTEAPFTNQVSTIEPLGDSWYKIRMQFTMSSDALNANLYWKIYNASESGVFAGDITKGVVVNSARLLRVA